MSERALQAYERHLAALASRDLGEIVRGYSDDAVLASAAGIGSGHDYIRAVFAAFLERGPQLVPTSTVVSSGDTVFVTWTATVHDQHLAGADTFVVTGDLITTHTGFFTETSD